MKRSIKVMLMSVQPLYSRQLGQVRKIMDLLRINTPDHLFRFGPVIVNMYSHISVSDGSHNY